MDLGAQQATAVRHHLENCLASFCAALDGGNEDVFLDVMRWTTISFNGSCPSDAQPDLKTLYRSLVRPHHAGSVHVFHNLQVEIEGNEAGYTAIFQRWTGGDRPACLSIGYFSGRMIAGPQVWYWAHHAVTSARTIRGRIST